MIDEPLFSVSPLPEQGFVSIIPLGALNPPGHTFPTDHLYFFLSRPDPSDHESAPSVSPVLAPGRAWITAVNTVEHVSVTPAYHDFTVRFAPCREFQAYFGHLSSLSDRLLAALDTGPEPRCHEYSTGGNLYHTCEQWGLEIEIQPGEQIGTAGGRQGQNALDMGALDARVAPLGYANPARLHASRDGLDPFHVFCPVDYFAPKLRDWLRTLFGYAPGGRMRTLEPLCGEVMLDLPGTVQGKWYLEGTHEPFPEDRHLALVIDNIDPHITVLSTGTSIPGLEPGAYPFVPQDHGQINRRFSQVRADGTVHCYERFIDRFGPPGATLFLSVLIEMIDAERLRIERWGGSSCGSGPWTLGERAVVFER